MYRREVVTGVVDGDTFETASRKHPVRLANVSAPERGENGYGEAKLKLAKLIRGKEVIIVPVGRDGYGRTLARVQLGDVSVNSAMKQVG